jgi:hypothetical protein
VVPRPRSVVDRKLEMLCGPRVAETNLESPPLAGPSLLRAVLSDP